MAESGQSLSRGDTSSIPERDSSGLSTYLEEVTIRMVSAVDSRSREQLREVANAYYAPNIELSHHILPNVGAVYASDRESYIESIIAYANKYNFRIQPHNATATVDEDSGTAEVFVTVITFGTAGIASFLRLVHGMLILSPLIEASEAIGNESVIMYHFKRTSKQGEGGEKWTVRKTTGVASGVHAWSWNRFGVLDATEEPFNTPVATSMKR